MTLTDTFKPGSMPPSYAGYSPCKGSASSPRCGPQPTSNLPNGEVRPAGREVIELAELVQYDDWNQYERAEAARRLVDQPDIVNALDRGMGLGAFLAAGPDLVDRLEAGTPPPGGVAIIRAATDWYRAGLTRPAPSPSSATSTRITYQPTTPPSSTSSINP